MDKKITYKPFGKHAILIEWAPVISEDILEDILYFKHKIEKEKNIKDIIVGYHSLTIIFTDQILDFLQIEKHLKSIYKVENFTAKQDNFVWEIPVCYDIQFGIDLEEISIKSKRTIEEIIQLHTKATYTVFFIGFLPGFLYLGGLDKQLFFDRKPNPRLQVPKGSVAIGGKQTGVYPSNSSGGWNIIGKTPLNFFDVKNEHPCFAKSGDRIKFTSINLDEFHQLEKEVENSNYVISKTLCND